MLLKSSTYQKLHLIVRSHSQVNTLQRNIFQNNYSSPSSLYLNESLIIIGLCVQSRLFTLKQLENKRQDDSVFDDKTNLPHICSIEHFFWRYTTACLKMLS